MARNFHFSVMLFILLKQGLGFSGSLRVWLSAMVAVVGMMFPQVRGQSADAPLMAYVGTFSSPLRDVLPTQVDLPPGNGGAFICFRWTV